MQYRRSTAKGRRSFSLSYPIIGALFFVTKQTSRFFGKRSKRSSFNIRLPSNARLKKGEQAVWQRRFWEHQIRDDGDLIRHVEYIHYNPVKHGLVHAPQAWPHSTFHRYVKRGKFHHDWGAKEAIVFDHEVGNE